MVINHLLTTMPRHINGADVFISHAANGQTICTVGGITLPETNIAPENWYLGHLGDYINFPFGTAFFPWAMLGFK